MVDSNRQTASNAKLERELKASQEENAKLRHDLKETRSLYNQLVNESSHEKFDERRVNFLKGQIVQLERQVMILSEALSSRSSVIIEVEGTLSAVADSCRSWITKEESGPTVSIPRAGLTKLVQSVESTRLRLCKNNEDISPEVVNQQPLFTSQYVKTGHPVTLMDMCSGRLDHLNLKHVAKLESKLCQLYKKLLLLLQSLTTVTSPDPSCPISEHVMKATNERLAGHVARSCDLLLETCQDLLAVSVLVPSAPWPPLSKVFVADLTVEKILSTLPNFPRSRQKEGRDLVQALLKAMNYSVHMHSLQVKVHKEELKFHQSVYQLQVSYIESLMEGVRDSYLQFQESMDATVCQPIREILDKFDKLKNTADEKELRQFLECFKDKSEQLREMVDLLSVDEGFSKEGLTALSQFGENFFKSLNAVKKESQMKCDTAARDLDTVKSDMEEHAKNGLLVFQKEALDAESRDSGGGGDNGVENERNWAVKASEVKSVENSTDIGCVVTGVENVKVENCHADEPCYNSVGKRVMKKPPAPKSISLDRSRRSITSSPSGGNSSPTVRTIQSPIAGRRTPGTGPSLELTRRSSSADSVSGIPSPSIRKSSLPSSQRPLSGSMSKLKLKPGNPKKAP